MTLWQRRCVVIFALCVVIVAVGCKPKPRTVGNPVPIVLSTDASNNCLQNGAVGTVDMYADGVTWSAANINTRVTITFANAACPFSTCYFSFTGGPQASGTATGTVGTTYPYSEITINGNACNLSSGGKTDGMIMK
jgi:hypothetical protein